MIAISIFKKHKSELPLIARFKLSSEGEPPQPPPTRIVKDGDIGIFNRKPKSPSNTYGDGRNGGIDNNGLDILVRRENKNMDNESKEYKYNFSCDFKTGEHFAETFTSEMELETVTSKLFDTNAKGTKMLLQFPKKFLILDTELIKNLSISIVE